jgi:hypothetical protein
MNGFKKGDEVILVPPIDMETEYIPWVGRYAKVIEKEKVSDGLTWYRIEVNGSELTCVPVDWLKSSKNDCTPR